MKSLIIYIILFSVIFLVNCADRLYSELPDEVTLYSPGKIYASAVALRWNKATSGNFASYKVYYDTKPGVSDSSILAISIFYKNDTTYLLNSLNENTTYYVKVFVYNSVSFSESKEISFTTVPCNCGIFTGEKQNGMILIPAGCFIGKENSIAAISYDYYMDTTEVTQVEWNSIMTSASIIDTAEIPLDKWDYILNVDTSTSQMPKAEVSWFQMIVYCNEKSKKNNKDTCYTYTSIKIDTTRYKISDITSLECNFSENGFRLPTEDEWEYAYRAGGWEEFYWGKDGGTLIDYPYTTTYPETKEDSMEISGYAWWGYNNDPAGIKEVAQKKPSRWRLYDIVGNVEEALWDIASGEKREKSRIDYTGSKLGPQTAHRAIIRGGSYRTGKPYSLTAWWRSFSIEFGNVDNENVGFRIVSTKAP